MWYAANLSFVTNLAITKHQTELKTLQRTRRQSIFEVHDSADFENAISALIKPGKCRCDRLLQPLWNINHHCSLSHPFHNAPLYLHGLIQTKYCHLAVLLRCHWGNPTVIHRLFENWSHRTLATRRQYFSSDACLNHFVEKYIDAMHLCDDDTTSIRWRQIVEHGLAL